jgi:hypothetical protein
MRSHALPGAPASWQRGWSLHCGPGGRPRASRTGASSRIWLVERGETAGRGWPGRGDDQLDLWAPSLGSGRSVAAVVLACSRGGGFWVVEASMEPADDDRALAARLMIPVVFVARTATELGSGLVDLGVTRLAMAGPHPRRSLLIGRGPIGSASPCGEPRRLGQDWWGYDGSSAGRTLRPEASGSRFGTDAGGRSLRVERAPRAEQRTVLGLVEPGLLGCSARVGRCGGQRRWLPGTC